MKKIVLSMALFSGVLLANVAVAGDCSQTLMGGGCGDTAEGLASHMRGNAVANAQASKELKAVTTRAKKQAADIAAGKKVKTGNNG